MPQDIDHCGAQATHEAELEWLRRDRDEFKERCRELRSEIEEVQRMRDIIRAECQALLEAKRALRAKARCIILDHVSSLGLVLGDDVAGELTKKADEL